PRLTISTTFYCIVPASFSPFAADCSIVPLSLSLTPL
ncbi:MAG: hypothetical protein ACI9JE_001085, partial [Candidatus Krumholzibacteriia bacterium]